MLKYCNYQQSFIQLANNQSITLSRFISFDIPDPTIQRCEIELYIQYQVIEKHTVPMSLQVNSSTNIISSEQNATKQGGNEQISFFSLFRFAQPKDAILIVLGTLCSILTGGALPTFSLLWGKLVNSFSNADTRVTETQNIFMYCIAAGIGSLLAGWGMHTLFMIAGERQAVRCRRQYFKSLMKHEIAWLQTQNQAEIATQFNVNSFSFQVGVGEKISYFLMNVFLLIFGIAIALTQGWQLTLVLLAIIPFLICSSNSSIKINIQKEKTEESIQSFANSKADQTINSIKVVKQFTSQQFQFEAYQNKLKETVVHDDTFISKLSWAQSFAFFFYIFIYPVGFWYGSQCVKGSSLCPRSSQNRYSSGSVLIIIFSLLLSSLNLYHLLPSFKKILEAKKAAYKIFNIIDRVPEIRSPENPAKIEELRGVFRFEGVTFAYPKDKTKIVLKNMNFEINARHSGFMGVSGCGKSTLFQLMMRLYDPDEGRITLDGVDLRDLDLKWLRSQIGYIGQEPLLFATSIRENMLLAKPEATDDEIITALRNAQIYDFINSLKDKLETYVGNNGSQLSGGQKQRIAIARALLKNPKIFFLDEATSALDRINQKLIQSTINKVLEDKITITIAHRIKTIANADQIFVLDDKGLIQKGKLDSLSILQQNKEYYEQLIHEERQDASAEPNTKSLIKEKSQPESQGKDYSEVKLNLKNLQEQAKNSIFRLIAQSKNYKGKLIMALSCSLINGLIIPSFGISFARILYFNLNYEANPSYSAQQIKIHCIIMFASCFFGGLVKKIQFKLFLQIGFDINRSLKAQIYQKILKMPVDWFDKQENHPSALINKIVSDGKIAKELYQLYFPHMLITLSSALFGIVMSLYFEWRSALVSIVLLPLLGVVSVYQASFSFGSNSTSEKLYKKTNEIISQSIKNIKTILSFCSEDEMLNRYSSTIEQNSDHQFKSCLLVGFMYGLSYFILFFIYGVIFYLEAVFILNYHSSVQDTLTAIFSIISAAIVVGTNLHLVPEISKIKKSATNLYKLLDEQDQDICQVKQGSLLLKNQIKGKIQFRDVSFKYESRSEYALRNVSFVAGEGKLTGIVGSSGCGKSTIIQLILRFYKPTAGEIFVDGVNVKDYDLAHLRKSFGVVSQQPSLFNGTVKENIVYNNQTISQEELKRANWILNFNKSSSSQGNSTDFLQQSVGPRGSHLSGGQKQRVAIARTVLRNPKIMLLDEATSALDKENEERVESILKSTMLSRTVINVTHKLETLKEFNKIILLKNGQIIEEGNFNQLIEKKGEFFNELHGMCQSK